MTAAAAWRWPEEGPGGSGPEATAVQAARVLHGDSGGCVAAARVLRDDSGCGCAGKAPQRGSRQQEPERVPQRVPGV